MKSETLRKLKLPDKPGVYFFLGPPKRSVGGLKGNLSSHKATTRQREILYIGKATSLRDRTKSYFANDIFKTRGPLIIDMVWKANDIKWEVSDSVLEALILESNLIKKHQPYYNTREKDDKSFNYVSITRELLPKVLVIRGKEIDFENKIFRGQKLQAIFGPFTNGGQLNEAMKIIRRIFPYIDASSSKKQNYQFYKQLGLTPDVAATPAYLQNIKYLKLFFKGRKKDIVRDMKKEMMKAAKMQEFEKADRLKRQLFSLQHINDVALLKNEVPKKQNSSASTFRIEAYDIAHMSGRNMVGVMTVVENNAAVKSEYKKFKIRTQDNTNDTGALTEVLQRRLAHTEWTYPDLIVVDGGVAQINAAEKVLMSLRVNIPVASVVKDERHKPKAIKGDGEIIKENKSAILLGNSEAHRFAIAYHKNMRGKNFLK